MPELRILIRQTSNWTLPDKKLAAGRGDDALHAGLPRLLHHLATARMGYGVEQQTPAHPLDRRRARALGLSRTTSTVLHEIEEAEIELCVTDSTW